MCIRDSPIAVRLACRQRGAPALNGSARDDIFDHNLSVAGQMQSDRTQTVFKHKVGAAVERVFSGEAFVQRAVSARRIDAAVQTLSLIHI